MASGLTKTQLIRQLAEKTELPNKTAAAFLDACKCAACYFQMQGNTLCSFFNLDVKHFAGTLYDSFGKAKTKRKIVEIRRGSQHDRMRDTVVFESNRHLLGHRIKTGQVSRAQYGKLNLRLHVLPDTDKN